MRFASAARGREKRGGRNTPALINMSVQLLLCKDITASSAREGNHGCVVALGLTVRVAVDCFVYKSSRTYKYVAPYVRAMNAIGDLPLGCCWSHDALYFCVRTASGGSVYRSLRLSGFVFAWIRVFGQESLTGVKSGGGSARCREWKSLLPFEH